MRRRQSMEIIDQPWCPSILRDGVTDYLQFIAGMGNLYRRVVPMFREALEGAGAREIVDLGSGAGGPWSTLLPSLERAVGGVPLAVTLTDLHPNMVSAPARQLGVHSEPVDARRVPRELTGFRTLFSLFHHFQPEEARDVLADAVEARQGIAVFEMTHRSLFAMVTMLMTPFMAAFVTPLIRPLSLWRLVFTYIVPLIPLVTAFDGVVSCLRTYTPSELLELAQGIECDDYEWLAGTASAFPPSLIPVTYLIGYPRSAVRRSVQGEGKGGTLGC